MLDTGYWMLDVSTHTLMRDVIESSIEHPESSINSRPDTDLSRFPYPTASRSGMIL